MSKEQFFSYSEVALEAEETGCSYDVLRQGHDECSIAFKRQGGQLTLSAQRVINVDEGLLKTLGNVQDRLLKDLLADAKIAQVKINQLFLSGKVEARLTDASGIAFWARLILKNSIVTVEDIEIEKNFDIDTDDILEEQERNFGHASKNTYKILN